MPDYMDDISMPSTPAAPPVQPDNNAQAGNYGSSQQNYGNSQSSGYNSYGSSQQNYGNPQNSGYNSYGSSQQNYGNSQNSSYNSYGSSQQNYGNSQSSGYNSYGSSQQGYGNSQSTSQSSSYAGSVYDQNYVDPYANTQSSAFRASQSTDATDIIKSILGALVGALPGFLLWLLMGNAVLTSMTTGLVVNLIGFICPLTLGVGTLIGYYFVTKDKLVSFNQSLLICSIVAIIMIYLANKMVYCIQISEICNNLEIMLQRFSGFTGYSKEELRDLMKLVDKKEVVKEMTGFEEVNFGTCFAHFSSILDRVDMKDDFIWGFFKSCLWAVCGSSGLIKYANKNNLI